MFRKSLVLAIALLFLLPAGSVLAETTAERDQRMEWWRDAQSGMFIHWGLYAIPAGEWEGKTKYAEWIRHKAKIPLETYDKFLDEFNPVDFDADEWARMAKGAGMKYLVITSKHHDGFCLWPSEVTDFDVESTPFERDILGELKQACDMQGIKFCLYHSIMDWHHPDYLPRRNWEKDRPTEGADYDRYVTYMKAQLKEIIERYDPAVLWFDGEWEGTWTHDRGIDLDDYCRSLKPDIIINNRVDKGRQGMSGIDKEGDWRGDFGTPEQEIPDTGLGDLDWESCMTMNGHWGYNKADKNFKSTTDLIHKTIDIASKGGNYLLNVGPMANGEFPQESIDRLAEIGLWMHKHGESIYGTTASPCEQPEWGRLTSKGNKIFLHVFDWPTDGQLVVPFTAKVTECKLLADSGRKFETEATEAGLTVSLTGDADNPIATVIQLTIDGEVAAVE